MVLKWIPGIIDVFHIAAGHLAVRPTSSRRGLVRPVQLEDPPSKLVGGCDALFTAGRPTTMSQVDRLLWSYEAFIPVAPQSSVMVF
jgi:hypothetical protein